MLNTRDLEARWLRYKIKSYIPHVTIFISLLVILIIVSTFLNSQQKSKILESSSVKQVSEPIKQEQTPVVNIPKQQLAIDEAIQIEKTNYEEVPVILKKVKKQTPLKSENRSLKLAPSLDFIKNMQHSSLPYYKEEPTSQVVPKPKNLAIVEEVQELDIVENTQVETVEEKTQRISIKRRNSQDDIRHIIKRFKKNNNPVLSLFVAKKYYELEEYHKEYNYALITNQIDRDIDASWIIFTKSLVKLGQKDMAIKTLTEYVESSHSSSAKILLNDILTGKFK